MAQRKVTKGLSGHPQEELVIKALMDGQSSRQIAEWTRPPVSHLTIWRYRELVLKPTMLNAQLLTSILPPTINRPHGNAQPALLEVIEKQLVSESGNSGKQRETVGKQEQAGKREGEVNHQVRQLAIQAITGAPALQIRENRIAAQQDRHRRLQMVMDARAKNMAEVPGGESGILTRDGKGIYKVDGTLLAEFREHEKQIAVELGQWQENTQGNVSIQIVVPPAGSGAVPRISYVSDDAIESEEIGLIQGNG